MARTIKTWISRAKPGRVDDALELFKAAKEYATDAEVSLLYADSAGDFSGTFTLVAAFENGAAAGATWWGTLSSLAERWESSRASISARTATSIGSCGATMSIGARVEVLRHRIDSTAWLRR